MSEKYRRQHHEIMRTLLKSYPEVREGQMFGYPAFFVGKRMFACIYGQGVGLKLPADEAVALLSFPEVVPFQPHGKRRMPEWVQINRQRSGDYRRDLQIIKRSIRFLRDVDSAEKK